MRSRVESALGISLTTDGRDWRLPDGRRLVCCYSKAHHRDSDFYIGLPNRLRDGDALVVGLGDRDVVFPKAAWLLQYSPFFSRSNDGRPNPRFVRKEESLLLNVAQINTVFPLDHLVGAYDILLSPTAVPIVASERRGFGRPYVELVAPAWKGRQPIVVDPDRAERGTQAHERTVRSLAEHLGASGIEPRLWEFPEPPFDLGWVRGGRTVVAEVKSLTAENEERQLRLGLGQVLRYRQAMQSMGMDCLAALVGERQPSDPTWVSLCESLEVQLAWPGAFDALIRATEGPL